MLSQVACFILLISIQLSHCADNDGFFVVSSTTQAPRVDAPNPEIQELRNTILAINKRLESFELQSRGPRKLVDHAKNCSCDGNLPKNCQEVLERGHAASGVYKIKPKFATEEISVLCNMKTREGGWTYILNRYDGSQDFYLDWSNYRKGFGSLNGEFWLGLENIHQLTGYELNQLLIELVDWDDKKVSAHYDLFTITGEREGYAMKYLQGYSGDAGDAISNERGMKFTTKDRDQDVSNGENCAIFSNAGWWYRDCKWGHPTGVYLGKDFDQKDRLKGIYWVGFHGNTYSLKEVRMMVKPHRPTHANPAL